MERPSEVDLATCVACLRDAGYAVIDEDADAAVFTVELGGPPTAVVTLPSDVGGTEAGFTVVEAIRARRRTLSAIGVVGGGARFRTRRDGPNLIVSFPELLARLNAHDRIASDALQEIESRSAESFLPRRAFLERVEGTEEVDAVEALLRWMDGDAGNGSVVVLGPHQSGKTTLLGHLRYLTARRRLAPGPDVGALALHRLQSRAARNQRRALEAGIAVFTDTLDNVNLVSLEGAVRHRCLLEAKNDVELNAMPGVGILRLARPAPEEVVGPMRARLPEEIHPWIDAAMARSGDLRGLAGYLVAYRPLLAALEDCRPPSSMTEATLDEFTQALVYDYVGRALLLQASEPLAYQAAQLAEQLEDAAVLDYTSQVNAIQGSWFTLSRHCGGPEIWIRFARGERLIDHGGELGYRDELCFASDLVRNALLVRRIIRDARLGRNEMRERLRLPPAAEALLRRELDAETVRGGVR